MNGHRSDVKHDRNKSAAEYFNKPDHTLENFKLAVIKKVKDITKQQREVQKKKFFSNSIASIKVLNRDCSFMSYYM